MNFFLLSHPLGRRTAGDHWRTAGSPPPAIAKDELKFSCNVLVYQPALVLVWNRVFSRSNPYIQLISAA